MTPIAASRSDAIRKANATRSAEQRREISRKANAAITSEQRSVANRKANATRRESRKRAGITLKYSSAHDRVYYARGSASDYACASCGDQARQWAYDHADPDELFSPGKGWYSEDPDHYFPLCVPCHRADHAERRAA